MTVATEGESIILHGVSWQTYQALSHDLETAAGKRLTYDQGILEIMTPRPSHERYKSRLSRIVEVTTEEMALEIASLGSTTWSREDLQRGLEPDACFYIQNEATIRHKINLDLRTDPPPDLAIEVDYTSSSRSRMGIYAALGVPEVWRFDGTVLTIECLVGTEYVPQSRSTVLPILQQRDIMDFLTASQAMGETSWVRTVRQWVREHL